MPSHHPARHCFYSIDYDAPTGKLTLNFTEGETYIYDGVSPAEWADLSASLAVGQLFNASYRRPTRQPGTFTRVE